MDLVGRFPSVYMALRNDTPKVHGSDSISEYRSAAHRPQRIMAPVHLKARPPMQIFDLGLARDARHLFWLYARGIVLVGVLATGFLGFHFGVDVTDHPGMPTANLLTKLYYSIGLFVFGGLDLGTPIGGPKWARVLLWFAYFAAPTVTATAVLEGLLRAINPERWRLRGLRNHIVIGGCSRLAILFLRRLRLNGIRYPVIIVDESPDHTLQSIARGHHARWLTSNIIQDDTIEALQLPRARRVLLVTGDDFANLDAASKMLAVAPSLRDRLVVHVADLRFKRLMGDAVAAEVFNIYQIAAVQLVETVLLPYFEQTDFRDIVVFAGFGRLGQTILDELQRRAPESMEAIIIIDTEADERSLVFNEQVGFSERYQRHIIEGSAEDLSVWCKAEALFDFENQTPAFLLITGSDPLNLRFAVHLAQKYPQSRVLARSYFRSPFAEALSKRAGFVTFSLAELIHDSLPSSWFE